MKRISLLIIAAMVFVSCHKVVTPAISVDVLTSEMDYIGGSISVIVTSNVSWTASCDCDNVKITPSSGVGGEVVKIVVSKNESIDTQSIRVTYTAKGEEASATAKTVITQAAVPFIYVAQSEFTAPADGGGLNISVYSNRSWTVAEISPVISVSPASGDNNATLFVTIPQNTTDLNRQFAVTLALKDDSSVKAQFTINQLSH